MLVSVLSLVVPFMSFFYFSDYQIFRLSLAECLQCFFVHFRMGEVVDVHPLRKPVFLTYAADKPPVVSDPVDCDFHGGVSSLMASSSPASARLLSSRYHDSEV